jgi:hypothetical protein
MGKLIEVKLLPCTSIAFSRLLSVGYMQVANSLPGINKKLSNPHEQSYILFYFHEKQTNPPNKVNSSS